MTRCPKCDSLELMIRRSTIWESIMVFFTRKKKYYCVYCNHAFRAKDRRRVVRKGVAQGAAVTK